MTDTELRLMAIAAIIMIPGALSFFAHSRPYATSAGRQLLDLWASPDGQGEPLAKQRVSAQKQRGLSAAQCQVPVKWRRNFDALAYFYAKRGHFEVPASDAALARWLRTQRKRWSTGALPLAQRQLLSELISGLGRTTIC